MSKPTHPIRGLIAGLALAVALAAVAAPSGAGASPQSVSALKCVKITLDNSCHLNDWSGPRASGSLSASSATGCAQVVSENSCYLWSHSAESTTPPRFPSASTSSGCAQVVSENSCYRWAHSGEMVVAKALSGGRAIGSTASTAPARSPVPIDRGFDWGDAGVGAAAGAGLVLVTLGLVTVRGRGLRLS